MKNMQRVNLKFVVLLISIIIIASETGFSQTSSFRLKTADSLFHSKRYTQSFEHYEEILKQKKYSPAMLLKMAYVQEGLQHIGPALYYLNLYYIATRDKTTLDKMDELATKYNLKGYEIAETNNVMSFYDDYNLYISVAIAALMVLMVSLSAYARLKLNTRPIASFSILIVLAIALFSNVIYAGSMTTAIVAHPSTYVMNGPSAAASVIDIISDGHRVNIIGQKDVWLEVSWAGNIGYIKQNALLPIEL
jgi:hypothetical protein